MSLALRGLTVTVIGHGQRLTQKRVRDTTAASASCEYCLFDDCSSEFHCDVISCKLARRSVGRGAAENSVRSTWGVVTRSV